MVLKNKNAIATIVFVLLCFVLYYIFPTKDTFQDAYVEFVFLALLPVVYNKFVFKKEAKEYGFSVGHLKRGFILSAVSILSSLGIVYILYKNFGFYTKYSLQPIYADSFANFLFYEISIVLFSIIVFDLFFRSFFMLNMVSLLGAWSILAQFGLFFVFLYMFVGSVWAFVPYLIFSFFSGVIVYKSRSIWYSVVSQLIFMMLVDLGYVVLFTK